MNGNQLLQNQTQVKKNPDMNIIGPDHPVEIINTKEILIQMIVLLISTTQVPLQN